VGLLIGYMTIKNSSDGYSFQHLLCYSLFTGFDCFWSMIRLIIIFSGSNTVSNNIYNSNDNLWQFYLYSIVILSSPLIYGINCYISVQLYKQLRIVLNELAA